MNNESKKVEETKEQKFKRLAEARVNNALQKIRLIGNLASPVYSYTPEDIEKIIVALNAGIAEVEEKFQKVLDKHTDKFKF
tara:strand:+ start:800 stop:1042 length:243 start_codon:yes stop_codon:yes gene_type:complete